jgi:hypothetical protein
VAGFFFDQISATISATIQDHQRARGRKLRAKLQGQSGVSVPIRQLEDEIAVIDAGLEKLPP